MSDPVLLRLFDQYVRRDRSVTGAFITAIDVLHRPAFPVRYCRLINTGSGRSRIVEREKTPLRAANSGGG